MVPPGHRRIVSNGVKFNVPMEVNGTLHDIRASGATLALTREVSAHAHPYAQSLPRRTARRQEADSGTRPRLRARLLPDHLRNVRLRADEPDRCLWRLSPALSALAVRH